MAGLDWVHSGHCSKNTLTTEWLGAQIVLVTAYINAHIEVIKTINYSKNCIPSESSPRGK